MKPRTTTNIIALMTLIGPAGAAAHLNDPILALSLMAISGMNLLAWEANYRRWRPWAVEACGLPDPNTSGIALKSFLAEAAVWIGIAIGATGWTLVGLRLIWGLVQLAEIGKFGRETEQQQESNNETNSSRATDSSRK